MAGLLSRLERGVHARGFRDQGSGFRVGGGGKGSGFRGVTVEG